MVFVFQHRNRLAIILDSRIWRKTFQRDHDGDEPFGLGEYAETVGPQGLLFIIKGRAPRNVNALAVLDL